MDTDTESCDEVTLPVSRAEKQLARQSLRRAKQREVEQKRNLDESNFCFVENDFRLNLPNIDQCLLLIVYEH